ncbi:MAG: hypothetical protein AAF146_04910 [Bacteroidota bacterium]
MERRWIVIEDSVEKAEGFIAQINQKFPEDEISWIYPYSRAYPAPRLFEAKLVGDRHFEEVVIAAGQGAAHSNRSASLDFYWCTNEATFDEAIRLSIRPQSILLLDVQLDALGGKPEVRPKLKEMVHLFFDQTESGLLATITVAANPFVTIKQLELDEAENKKSYIGKYSFTGLEEEKEYERFVADCGYKWRGLYNPRESFNRFWDQMEHYSELHLHNWRPDKQNECTQSGAPLWDQDWRIPIQLSLLIKALEYEKDEFLADLEWDLSTNKSRAIGECLKQMGSSTRGLTVMAVLLVTWMAFRRNFGRQSSPDILELNQSFVRAILDLERKDIPAEKDFRQDYYRHGLIGPPQDFATTKKTALALYKMMDVLLVAKGGVDCNIQSLALNEERLRIDLNINPEALSLKLSDQYRHKFIRKDPSRRGGDSTQRIINFFAWSNWCSGRELGNSRQPLLGGTYSFKIFPTSDQQGITLVFGR